MFALRYLRAGDLFVDVGANIGVYSCLALQREAHVICFEPTPAAREVLLENLRLNGTSFEVRSVALADTVGPARFRCDMESSNHLLLGPDACDVRSILVEVRRLDDELAGQRASLIKVDAEGFDLDVLRGGRRVLERDRPPLLLEVWSGARGLRELLVPMAYDFYRYDFSVDVFEPMPDAFAGHGYLIALPHERTSEIVARVRAAAWLPPPEVTARWLRA